jgi:hypothetical protein
MTDGRNRTILVHLNCEVPADFAGTADELADEIAGAIQVGTDPGHTPLLCEAGVTIPMAEEV